MSDWQPIETAPQDWDGLLWLLGPLGTAGCFYDDWSGQWCLPNGYYADDLIGAPTSWAPSVEQPQ